MVRKITISMEPAVYDGLHRVIGVGRISAFINEIAKPFVVKEGLASAYKDMAADKTRELEAHDWVENLASGGTDEER
ncbi:MAG: addiction module antitoxin [Myxococcota bacterium]|jgi:hypothetical protein